jgi:hypothetical protein
MTAARFGLDDEMTQDAEAELFKGVGISESNSQNRRRRRLKQTSCRNGRKIFPKKSGSGREAHRERRHDALGGEDAVILYDGK